MKCLLSLCLLISCACCFRFAVNGNWYHTEDIQYELLQLPDTYVIDCWDANVQCVAESASTLAELRVDVKHWLTDHYGEVRVNDGVACFTDFWGPSVVAELSCETMKSQIPWAVSMYDARNCTLTLHSTLPDSVSIALITVGCIWLPYTQILIALSIIRRKEKERSRYRVVDSYPALRSTLRYQIIALLLFSVYWVTKLWEKTFPVRGCHSKNPEDPPPLLAALCATLAVILFVFVLLAVFSFSVRQVTMKRLRSLSI